MPRMREPSDAEPRRWLYGLTADEWFHLACEGEDSEVGPCCGAIGQLREWLQALATCQGAGEAHLLCSSVVEAYESALAGHDTLADPAAFPLLHKVMAGVRADETPCSGCGARWGLHRSGCNEEARHAS